MIVGFALIVVHTLQQHYCETFYYFDLIITQQQQQQ